MPTANITTKSGSKISIEGTHDEVAALLAVLCEANGPAPSRPAPQKPKTQSKVKATLGSLLSELTEEGFFKEPKELGAVKIALKNKGHFYPATTLSPAMLRSVRKKELRRLKENKRWVYVGS